MKPEWEGTGLAEWDTGSLSREGAWRNTRRPGFAVCPQETRAGAGSWVLNHHENLTWPRLASRPAAREVDKVLSCRQSEPAPPAPPSPRPPLQLSPPRPLGNLRPASETPVVTPPGCRPSAARRTVSGGRSRCQPLRSLTLTSEEPALWLLAGQFPQGPEHTGPHPCPFLPGSSSSPPATHRTSLPHSCICLITELLVSQAGGSGGQRGVRVLTHLIIPRLRCGYRAGTPLLACGAPHPGIAL